MPAPNATSRSPPPAAQAGSSRTPSPPSPSSSLHQVGSRQATRTRTRTRRNVSSSLSTSHRVPHYSHEDHPLSPHNLERHGFHSFRCLGVPFHVRKRYTYIRELGIGAYGCVALCRDEALDCSVAIKKVTRVFERDVLARRALREVAILRHIGMCDNVTALLDFDATFIEFSEIYIVLSASEADLSQIIRSGQALSDAHHQYFVAQILRGVRYMHAAKIVHRDLKPGNLLVNADCALRLCDFGLARAYADPSYGTKDPCNNDDAGSAHAGETDDRDPLEGRESRSRERDSGPGDERMAQLSRSLSPQSDLKLHTQRRDSKGKQRRLNYPGGPLTEYVATRWYRAPEVMLCFREGYGPELDMWSVGCILAELIGGQPIFPGKDYVDQITRINNILGSPNEAVIEKIGSERAKTYIKALPKMPAVPLQNLFPNASPDAIDLLARLLTWDPAERLTADEALRHPWLKAYHESNARWQPPPAFDKFAEVEFIRSLREFKGGLQREAEEVRQEIEALEMEEADANDGTETSNADADAEDLDGAHNDHGDDDDEQRDGQHSGDSGQSGPTSPSADEGRFGTQADGAGNEQRAGADQKDESCTDADAPQRDSMSPTGASTRSRHLPEVFASSSGFSSADSLSSTETSGDEADPPSPRSFDSCRIDSAAQAQLHKDGALAHAPSFFRLGHEEEGRHLIDTLDDDAKHGLLGGQLGAKQGSIDDVFVPQELLHVAQGLVQHQLDVAVSGVASTAASAATLELHDQSHEDSFLTTSKGDASIGYSKPSDAAGERPSASAPTPVSGAGSASLRSASGAAAGRSGFGGGSTPSLGKGLLENMAITPVSSTAVAGHASQRHSKQLVLIQDGIFQSSAPLLGQLIGRSADKAQPTLLVSVLRHPSTYLRPRDVRHVTVLDGTSFCDGYDETDDDEDGESLKLNDWRSVARAVFTKLGSMNSQARVTVMIDSLDTIAEQCEDGIEGAYSLVKTVLGKLNAFGRLVVAFQGDASSTSAALLSMLNTPLVWASKASTDGDAGSAAAAGTILTARLHAPALIRYIHRNYGLRPASTSTAIAEALVSEVSAARALESGAAAFQGVTDSADEADVRFWDILRNISSRGALGIPAFESGGGTGGWWADGTVPADEVECVFKSSGHASSSSRHAGGHSATLHPDRICFEDVVGPATQDGEFGRTPRSNGWGFLELKFQARSGRISEELDGCVVEETSQGRKLYLRALDMADRRGVNTQQTGATPVPQPQPQSQQLAARAPAVSADVAGGGAAAPASDPHASMMSRLPFNLSETDSQRARREDVPLPYAFYQNSGSAGSGQAMRGSTGNSTIFFEPEAGDDEDDEDPDDDLDL